MKDIDSNTTCFQMAFSLLGQSTSKDRNSQCQDVHMSLSLQANGIHELRLDALQKDIKDARFWDSEIQKEGGRMFGEVTELTWRCTLKNCLC